MTSPDDAPAGVRLQKALAAAGVASRRVAEDMIVEGRVAVNGRGVTAESQGLFSLSRPCPRCRGNGTVIEDPCDRCHGSGRERRTNPFLTGAVRLI